MYAPSSRYRRRSSAANFRLVDEHQLDNHDRQRHFNISLNRQHCRCCSMSASDLLSTGRFDEMENNRNSDTGNDCRRQDWRTFDDDDDNDDDDSKMAAVETTNVNFQRRDRRPNSRTPSIVSTLSSPNILLDYQQTAVDNGSRLRERLAASIAGLKELEILREKHRRMVDDVKTHLKLAATDAVYQRHQTNVDGFSGHANGSSNAPRSPSPAELSSNISHRSSLSMDSGVCLSLTSDPASVNGVNGYRPSASSYYPHHAHHQRRFSTDSAAGGYHHHNYLSPTRKTSWTTSSANALYDSLTNAGNNTQTSDDEGCYAAPQHARDGSVDGPRTYSSLASITAALAAAEATVAAPRTNGASAYRYRRRFDAAPGSAFNGSTIPSRPRSLYNCYPEENQVVVEPPMSPRQFLPQQIVPSNMRLLRRTSVQYRPQVPTIVANLPESKSANLHSECSWDSSVVCRRRPNGGRGSSAIDPVFRASRVFIDTLPEHEAILDPYDYGNGEFRNNVSLRPRRYETRRPRPTSVAVPPSVSASILASQHYPTSSSPPPPSTLKKQNSSDTDRPNLVDWRRTSFSWEEAQRILDPAFATRSSSSSTLVRQHSTASAASNGNSNGCGRPSPKISDRRRRASKSPSLNNGKTDNAPMVNVSVVTTGDTSSASSSCGGVASDGGVSSDNSSLLVVNGQCYNNSTAAAAEHASISRSMSSQSSDSNKSRRNKEKTWRESPHL